MINLASIQKIRSDTVKYKDCKNNVINVYHSVVFTDEEKSEIESRIINDIFHIFNNKKQI